MVVKIVRRITSHGWPVVETTVSASVYNSAGYGCDTTDLHFDYSFEGQEYSGFHAEPFIVSAPAKNFPRNYAAGTIIRVRVNPTDPDVTVALIQIAFA